jgi:serine protease Do
MEDLGLTLAPAAEVDGAGESGVAVTDVDSASEAAEKGLKAGDVIIEVGGKSVTAPSDVVAGIRDASRKGRKAVLLQIRSDRQTRFVALSLNERDRNGDRDRERGRDGGRDGGRDDGRDGGRDGGRDD